MRGGGWRFCRAVSSSPRRAGIAYVFEYHHYVVLLLPGDDRAIRGRKARQKMRGVGAPTYVKYLLSFSIQRQTLDFPEENTAAIAKRYGAKIIVRLRLRDQRHPGPLAIPEHDTRYVPDRPDGANSPMHGSSIARTKVP
jgi:hypothetical protein